MTNPASLLFSVVICTFERHDLLPRAIASVMNQDFDPACYDIWVIDNSPPSKAREASKKRYAEVARLHYIEVDIPGLSNARNVAIEKAAGKYIVFLDDDAEASLSWLRHYKNAFDQLGEKAAVINGKIVADFEAPRPPWLHDSLLGYLSVIDWYPEIRELPNSHSPVGANIAFLRDALIECGCFRTALGRQVAEANTLLSGEESGLVDALRQNGWKLYYAPLPQATHHIPANRLTREWFRRRATWQGVSDQIRVALKPEHAPTLWSHIIKYLRQVPKEQSPFMGMFWDTEDPELFRQQLAFLQFMTQITLSQGRYPPEIFGDQK
ncbi:MAG: glycosyltransferase family 2 protein [Alphaproteobacteria bacterium]|nr:glycosyltransferase family 2 protein [Alphaproteobacteria bacterium]